MYETLINIKNKKYMYIWFINEIINNNYNNFFLTHSKYIYI